MPATVRLTFVDCTNLPVHRTGDDTGPVTLLEYIGETAGGDPFCTARIKNDVYHTVYSTSVKSTGNLAVHRDPLWQETFDVFVPNPESDLLVLDVRIQSPEESFILCGFQISIADCITEIEEEVELSLMINKANPSAYLNVVLMGVDWPPPTRAPSLAGSPTTVRVQFDTGWDDDKDDRESLQPSSLWSGEAGRSSDGGSRRDSSTITGNTPLPAIAAPASESGTLPTPLTPTATSVAGSRYTAHRSSGSSTRKSPSLTVHRHVPQSVEEQEFGLYTKGEAIQPIARRATLYDQSLGLVPMTRGGSMAVFSKSGTENLDSLVASAQESMKRRRSVAYLTSGRPALSAASLSHLQEEQPSGADTVMSIPPPQVSPTQSVVIQTVASTYAYACQRHGTRRNRTLSRFFTGCARDTSGLTLDLHANTVGPKGFLPLADVVGAFPKLLGRLLASGQELDNAAVVHFTRCVTVPSGLTSVDFSHNPISREGGEALVKWLSGQPDLLTLRLGHTLLTDVLLLRINKSLERRTTGEIRTTSAVVTLPAVLSY